MSTEEPGRDSRLAELEAILPFPIGEAHERRFQIAAGRIRVVPDAYRPLIPVAPSELLRLAGSAPILFQRHGGHWSPVAVTDPEACLSPPVSENWRWRSSYVPYAMRLLPFIRQGGVKDDGTPVRGIGAWRVDEGMLLGADAGGTPFLDSSGEVSHGMGGVLNELEATEKAMLDLSRSLSILTRVSLLSPLPVVFRLEGNSSSTASLYAIDIEKLQKLEPHWLGALASGRPSPLEIAIASVFSMRLLGGFFLSRSSADLDVWLGEVMRVVVNQDPKASRPTAKPSAASIAYALDDTAILDISSLL